MVELKINYKYGGEPNPLIIGVVANKSVNGEIVQSDIPWRESQRADDNRYSRNTFQICDNDVDIIKEADELVVMIDEPDPWKVIFYDIYVDGKHIEKDVIFEEAEYVDITLSA